MNATTSGNTYVYIAGGTISGSVRGTNGSSNKYIYLSGAPAVGNGTTAGIYIDDFASGYALLNGTVSSSTGAITLVTQKKLTPTTTVVSNQGYTGDASCFKLFKTTENATVSLINYSGNVAINYLMSALTVFQYGIANSSSGLYKSLVDSSITSITSTSFSTTKCSINYCGNLVYTPTCNNALAIVAVTITDQLGTNIKSQCSVSSVGVITIPNSVYIAHTTITVVYTITAYDGSSSFVCTVPVKTGQSIVSVSSYSTTSGGYTTSSGSDSSKIAFLIKSSGCIDVLGSTDGGSSWGQCGYSNNGFCYHLWVDGSETVLNIPQTSARSCSVSASNVTLTLTTEIQYDADTNIPYLKLTHTIYNPNGYHVKLASEIDTYVDGQDTIPITVTSYGFKMVGSSHTFAVYLKNAYGVDNISTAWYGNYSSRGANLWNDNQVDVSNTDSGVAFSWDFGTSTSSSKAMRISLGEYAE